MNVDDVVAARVAAARARIDANRRRRVAQQAARSKALALRHAQKLRNLAASPAQAGVATPDPEGDES